MMKKTALALALSASMFAGVSAQAATDDYGTLLAGSFTPAATFATLSYDLISGNQYQFTLTANDLNSLFTNDAFIGAIAVDAAFKATSVSNVVGGVNVTIGNGGGPGGNWDFRFVLGKGQDRLTANETVSWVATFGGNVTLDSDSFALHVQGLTGKQGGSAWYIANVPAVPEADTYAMLALGLGVLGVAARRRKAS